MSLRPNLNSVTEEIQAYLEAEHFVVFRSLSRITEETPIVLWDTERHPEFKSFLDCALQLGIRLIHLHIRDFSPLHREEAIDRLEESDLPAAEHRDMRKRIEELAIYEGLTCCVEMSFDFEGRLYLFELHTDWYDDWHEILDELEDLFPPPLDPDGEAYGGYFSNN